MARQLYIVSRSGPELFEGLHKYFLGRPDVAVVRDRRQGEREVSAVPERRRHNVSKDLRTRGWATIDPLHLGDLGTGEALQPAGRNEVALGGPRTPYRFQVILESQEVATAGDGAPRELPVLSAARRAGGRPPGGVCLI